MTKITVGIFALVGVFGMRGATFGSTDLSNAIERLSVLPQMTVDVPLAAAVGLGETAGARLAGLAVTLPTISGESIRSLVGLQDELLRALERVELPVAPAVGAGMSVSLINGELPWATILAFAGGAFMLLCLFVFAGALIRMSMEDARKQRRMRRRYAP